jgi:hypothetical protein
MILLVSLCFSDTSESRQVLYTYAMTHTRPTRPFAHFKKDLGTFSPRRIRAYESSKLTFTANFKIPFFIQVGYNNPVLGEVDPSPPRTAKLPPLEPGDFPVSVSEDGKIWKEIDHLIVEAVASEISEDSKSSKSVVVKDDPWQVFIGIMIGLGIVGIVTAFVLSLYVRHQREKRKRRSDDPQFRERKV